MRPWPILSRALDWLSEFWASVWNVWPSKPWLNHSGMQVCLLECNQGPDGGDRHCKSWQMEAAAWLYSTWLSSMSYLGETLKGVAPVFHTDKFIFILVSKSEKIEQVFTWSFTAASSANPELPVCFGIKQIRVDKYNIWTSLLKWERLNGDSSFLYIFPESGKSFEEHSFLVH